MLQEIRDSFTFDDLLLEPKYSEIESRSSIDLSVDLGKFKFSQPVIPANMKNISGEQMCKFIAESGGLAILHRFMPIEEQIQILNRLSNYLDNVGFSVGVKKESYCDIDALVNAGAKILCIDIAHGDSKLCVDTIKYIKNKYNHIFLIAGNVATAGGAERLWKAGADVIKCGIGGGCLAANTRILMSNGFYKNIKDVNIGDYVINMNGNPVKVLDSFSTGFKNVAKTINSNNDVTYVTKDHKFWNGNEWKEISKYKTYDKLSFPKNIKFNIKDTFEINLPNKIVRPSYELGYLLGSFLSQNSYIKENRLGFLFDNNNLDKHTIDKINLSIKKITNKEAKNVIIESSSQFSNEPTKSILNIFTDDDIFKIFNFNINFPETLLVKDKNYVAGLNEGLRPSNCKKLKELKSVTSLLLDYKFTDRYLLDYSEQEKMEVFDLTVDCDTHSFIANDMVVHNSLCTTRIETGNGAPQLSMLMEVSSIKERLELESKILGDNRKFYTISDGGAKNSGDLTKALCFSDMVMVGNLFSGTDEAPGDIIYIDNIPHKKYEGSSTHKTNRVEGVCSIVKCKGASEQILNKLKEGIQSGCSYQGVSNLNDLKKSPVFVKITNAGLIESKPHDVKVV